MRSGARLVVVAALAALAHGAGVTAAEPRSPPQISNPLTHTPEPDWHCASEAACSKLCDEGIGRSCRRLGELEYAGDEANVDKYMDAFRRACDARDGDGCLFAANVDKDGGTNHGLGGFDRKVAGYYERGCAYGNQAACLYAQLAHALAPLENLSSSDPSFAKTRASQLALGRRRAWLPAGRPGRLQRRDAPLLLPERLISGPGAGPGARQQLVETALRVILQSAPASLQASPEFASLCPQSAACMAVSI
jgi:hypothetical protein